jgi:LysM repeat protein
MSSFLGNSSTISRTPLYFHRVKEEDTMESIASKYNVDVQQILNDNSGAEVKSGEIIVVDLRKSGLF